jgi:CO dehydrogenase/acetyl-CoA synthase delta subunit
LKASYTSKETNTYKVELYIDVEDISLRMSKKDEALRDCVVKLGNVKCYVVFEDVSDRSLIITQCLEAFQTKISLMGEEYI